MPRHIPQLKHLWTLRRSFGAFVKVGLMGAPGRGLRGADTLGRGADVVYSVAEAEEGAGVGAEEEV